MLLRCCDDGTAEGQNWREGQHVDVEVEKRKMFSKKEGRVTEGGKQKNEETRGKNDRKWCGDSSSNCNSHC